MKFQQLPIGTRFEYDGKVYVKTGPIAAAAEDGGQRMIPRHVELQPRDGVAPARRPEGRRLDAMNVLAAFEAFCREVPGVADLAGFEAARQRFLDRLG